jgi:hypothetical protein
VSSTLARDDTIQDIIDRIESARDRCQNAADDEGVRDADLAIADLRDLSPSALPTARDIEDYFNERMAIRVRRAQGPRHSVPAVNEPMPVHTTGIDRTRDTVAAEDSNDDLSDDS